MLSIYVWSLKFYGAIDVWVGSEFGLVLLEYRHNVCVVHSWQEIIRNSGKKLLFVLLFHYLLLSRFFIVFWKLNIFTHNSLFRISVIIIVCLAAVMVADSFRLHDRANQLLSPPNPTNCTTCYVCIVCWTRRQFISQLQNEKLCWNS